MLYVTNEIKKLKKVLVHRPGKELLSLTPATLKYSLFDDIPYLDVAQKEHDEFVKVLRKNDIEVIYLEDLITETLKENKEVKIQFIHQFIREARITQTKYKNALFAYLSSFKDIKQMILKTMEGIKYEEIDIAKENSNQALVTMLEVKEKFITEPMPNLYFTRDPAAAIGEDMVCSSMQHEIRNREGIYVEYIFKYNKKYKKKVHFLYNRFEDNHMEGGDILNLTENIILVGISERTDPEAVDMLAKNIFKYDDTNITTILAFNIPEARASMHLDTVFTQIDEYKFLYHRETFEKVQVFEIKRGKAKNKLEVTEKTGSLEEILTSYLGNKVTLISCGGNNDMDSSREQWNDASNTLCIQPGKVIVYDRNIITNQILKENKVKVLEIPSSELSRGRGGPRCMSMPLARE